MYRFYTEHAKSRFRQRGISEEVIECVEKYGENFHALGGAVKVKIPRSKKNQVVQELKRIIRLFEKTDRVVLVEKEGNILTGYHLI